MPRCLAQVLHAKGFFLTGSDNNETDTLAAVRALGIPVQVGQRPENLGDADLVVYSAAIAKTNPERAAAEASGVEMMERSELLGLVSEWYSNAVCIAGTHGKTTTSSMLAQILFTAGIDLSAVIGGNTIYYLSLEGAEQVYYSISAAQQRSVVILNPGDSVTIRYSIAQGEDSSILDALQLTVN